MKVIIDGIEYVPVNNSTEIKVGDRVKVVNEGEQYDSYYTWSGWADVPLEYAVRFDYRGRLFNGEVCTVIYVGEHDNWKGHKLVVIEDCSTRQCYLIDSKGLEKCECEQKINEFLF